MKPTTKVGLVAPREPGFDPTERRARSDAPMGGRTSAPQHTGIFGPRAAGKTYLAQALIHHRSEATVVQDIQHPAIPPAMLDEFVERGGTVIATAETRKEIKQLARRHGITITRWIRVTLNQSILSP